MSHLIALIMFVALEVIVCTLCITRKYATQRAVERLSWHQKLYSCLTQNYVKNYQTHIYKNSNQILKPTLAMKMRCLT